MLHVILAELSASSFMLVCENAVSGTALVAALHVTDSQLQVHAFRAIFSVRGTTAGQACAERCA